MDALLIETVQYGSRVLKASKHSPLAQRMAEIQRRKTFTEFDISLWKAMGFTFTVQRLPE